MIEINFGKLVLLALIALIVLGPEKLPKAARMAGAMVRRVRGSWDSVRGEVERELQVEEIRRTAREAVARMDAAQAELDATVRQVRAVAVPPSPPVPADDNPLPVADNMNGDLFGGAANAPPAAPEPTRDQA